MYIFTKYSKDHACLIEVSNGSKKGNKLIKYIPLKTNAWFNKNKHINHVNLSLVILDV